MAGRVYRLRGREPARYVGQVFKRGLQTQGWQRLLAAASQSGGCQNRGRGARRPGATVCLFFDEPRKRGGCSW
eukprot:5777915-Alexandrium_andersonii.AAC.1